MYIYMYICIYKKRLDMHSEREAEQSEISNFRGV